MISKTGQGVATFLCALTHRLLSFLYCNFLGRIEMYKNGKPNYNEVLFNSEQTTDIIQMYLNGVSSVNIGKKYNVSHKVVLKLLHKNGIGVNRGYSTRKYSLNEKYFDNIDTQEKAYILGLLYSDGSNNIKKSTVSISLQEEDRDILEKIREEIGIEKPLEYLDYSNKHDFGYHYKNQYRLLMFSSYMCNRLNEIGMIPNKSLCMDFPDISDSLYRHFVRGLFDGDGSVCMKIINENNHPVTTTITSTESVCQSIKTICEQYVGISPGIYDASCHNGVTKVIVFSGRNISKRFLDWIYQDATIYLDRKYYRYINYYDLDDSLSA